MAVRTDFVAGEVLAAQDLDDTFAAKIDYATPVNTQTGTTYTFVLADGLRLTTANNASASTFTVPPQSSVVWLANSIIRLVNLGAGAVTINGGSGVTVTNTAATVAQFQSVDCIRTGSNAWTVVVAGGAGGKILQVVRATDTTDRSTTSATFVDANISVTITPQKSDSAIILLCSVNVTCASGVGIIPFAELQITDNSNNALSGAEKQRMLINLTNTSMQIPYFITARDTPATTSATTYKLRFNSTASTRTATINNVLNTGQLYAIEVSA